MNTKSLIVAAVASFAAFGAMAQEATLAPTSQSVASRASVHQEAVSAVASGQVLYGEASRSIEAPRASERTRAEVSAEARMALRQGKVGFGEA